MLLEGCWTYMLDEDGPVEEAVFAFSLFLFKLHQPVDQGRAASAGRENRGGGTVWRDVVTGSAIKASSTWWREEGRAVAEQQELQRMRRLKMRS